jgi:hypothetical protein
MSKYSELLSDNQWKIKRLYIINRDKRTCRTCRTQAAIGIFNMTGAGQFFPIPSWIHVHHTYYQENKLPWDYPDESLQTLCASCHSLFHLSNKVPYKDKLGNIVANMNMCERCNGRGHFPEYKHVKNGICFECGGPGYIVPIGTLSFEDKLAIAGAEGVKFSL